MRVSLQKPVNEVIARNQSLVNQRLTLNQNLTIDLLVLSPFSSFIMLYPSSTLHCWAVRLGQGTRLVVLARFGPRALSEPPPETFTEAGR
jgi:hypothetical protein